MWDEYFNIELTFWRELQERINLRRKETQMTTKQEMQEQAKKLQEELDKLHQQIDSMPDEVETKRERFKVGMPYWCINGAGEVFDDFDMLTSSDDKRYSIGNYFKTRQEAEEYRENLLTKQRLKDLALRLNKGVKIDWNDADQAKYTMSYSEISNELHPVTWWETRYMGAIYSLDVNFFTIAKKEIGEDKLIKLIKSGV